MHTSVTSSPFASRRALPLEAVTLTGGFWARKQAVNRQVSLRRGYQKLEEFGNIDNLKLAAGLSDAPFRGPLFMDSDLYKWLEAIAYDQVLAPDAELMALAEGVIDLLEAAQGEDGYLNSYWQMVKPDERWSDLDHGHEFVLLGRQGSEHITAGELARRRNTIAWEVLSSMAQRVDRVYYPEAGSAHQD